MNANGERDGESLAAQDEAALMPSEMAQELMLLSRSGSASHRQDQLGDDDDASKQQRSGSTGSTKSGLATLFNSSRSGSIEGSLLLSSQPGTLLPTLSEERDNDEDDANGGDGVDEGDGPESPTPTQTPSSTLGGRYCSSNDSEMGDEHDNRLDHSHECGEEADGSAAFHAMLRILSTDVSLLALLVDDVSPHKLFQVREALQDCASLHQQNEEDRQHDVSFPSSASSRLARVRVMVAVDTLRLLLERFRPLDVRRAVDTSIRTIFSETSAFSGVASLAKAPSVLTTRNIARVVLTTRQQLLDQSGGGSDHRPVKHSSKPRLELAKSLLLHTRSSHATPSSPSSRGSRSPPALSVRTSGSLSPATTRRPTSILAMEGDHLMLQEKIARFEHRGPSPVSGSVPRVRRDSDENSEVAAKRRQRALEYAARQQKLNLTY